MKNKRLAIQIVFNYYIESVIKICGKDKLIEMVNNNLYVKIGKCKYVKYMDIILSIHELYYLSTDQILTLWSKLLFHESFLKAYDLNHLYQKKNNNNIIKRRVIDFFEIVRQEKDFN